MSAPVSASLCSLTVFPMHIIMKIAGILLLLLTRVCWQHSPKGEFSLSAIHLGDSQSNTSPCSVLFRGMTMDECWHGDTIEVSSSGGHIFHPRVRATFIFIEVHFKSLYFPSTTFFIFIRKKKTPYNL